MAASVVATCRAAGRARGRGEVGGEHRIEPVERVARTADRIRADRRQQEPRVVERVHELSRTLVADRESIAHRPRNLAESPRRRGERAHEVDGGGAPHRDRVVVQGARSGLRRHRTARVHDTQPRTAVDHRLRRDDLELVSPLRQCLDGGGVRFHVPHVDARARHHDAGIERQAGLRADLDGADQRERPEGRAARRHPNCVGQSTERGAALRARTAVAVELPKKHRRRDRERRPKFGPLGEERARKRERVFGREDRTELVERELRHADVHQRIVRYAVDRWRHLMRSTAPGASAHPGPHRRRSTAPI